MSEGTGGPRTLTANLDNQGTTLVEEGVTFNLSGNLLNASTGVLGGSGTFNFTSATVTHEGTVAPGASPGILSFAGNFPLTSASRFDAEIGGFVVGTEHDRLAVSSPIDLNGAIRAGLINGFFPKKDDAFTVLTYPSRTGTFATLDNPLPDRIAWEVQYGPTSAQLVVLNTAPTLAAIADQTVNELTQLSVTASATDQDLPAQTMTYSLDEAPAGRSINPSTGQITWTPTEAQGPGNFDVTVRVTDNGAPALGHTTSFSVTVNEVNVAPQLVLPGAQNIAELVELVFTINGTDADLPANALTYELVSGPTGASFNAATREFRWTPTEAQGPGNFTATFRVTDNSPVAVNSQQLSAEGDVSIAVAEVNRQPVLTGIGNQTAPEEALFSLTATATDPDLPANGLAYSLDTAPTGMTINPTSGQLSWTPTESQGPGNHNVTVRVTDNGSPALAHTTSFSVTVTEVNLPPVLTAVPDAVVHAGTPFTIQLSATDPDQPANTFTYSLIAGPAGATVSPTGEVSWAVPAAAAFTQASFTVRATDNGSPAQSDDESFQLTITGTLAVLTTVRTGDQLAITWRAIPGQTYRLVRANSLPATTWDPVPGDVPATAGTASKTLTLGAEVEEDYFLIELLND